MFRNTITQLQKLQQFEKKSLRNLQAYQFQSQKFLNITRRQKNLIDLSLVNNISGKQILGQSQFQGLNLGENRNRQLFFQNRFLFSKRGDEAKEALHKVDQAMNEEAAKQNEFEDDNSFEREEGTGSLYIFGIGAFALTLGYLVMQVNVLRHEKKSNKVSAQSYSGRADIGGPWKLYDLEGKEFTDQNLKGSYYLIYFGFCNCPDICPNSLHKLSKGLKKLKEMPESKFIKLKTVFVSVDPDRDDAEKIGRFLSIFDADIIGLTSTSNDDPDLKDMLRKFRIYSTKIEYDMMDEEEKQQTRKSVKSKAELRHAYTIDHTVLTYLMDDKNQYVTHLGSNLNEHELSQIIMEKILENERQKINDIRN
ncbi:Thioredoxin-like fold [Pseudocohnilembus persalinus]|uniref:Thioredoxin-like fold n=1 Tax=Pseudocohnilembus persalinus TaxID=266149 RepID=A0A0V0Q9H4_PSEPJ|nr:Thioredoxin-like fold [Pseudocohnilembus persalinus]|eukprot:KRW98827.1 Thioredoxin-like fold [Pseudocohnilembus persalinus]